MGVLMLADWGAILAKTAGDVGHAVLTGLLVVGFLRLYLWLRHR